MPRKGHCRRNRWIRRGVSVSVALLAAVMAAAAWYVIRVAPVGTGFVAKYLCSTTFISGREPETVYAQDVAPVNPLAGVVRWRIEPENRSATATIMGLFKAVAIYRPDCGCTLVKGRSESELRRQRFFKTTLPAERPLAEADLPWPRGGQGAVDPAVLGLDGEKLGLALDRAFAEPGPGKQRLTRAVVVVYRGRLVAERYAPGFHPQMPLLGWSMSKSVTNAMVGILVKKGWLDLEAPAPVGQWDQPDDLRRTITLDQLLRMSSGLEFHEIYSPLDDVTAMLYTSSDFSAYAAGKPLAAAPDSRWHYSSGTANIVAGIVRQAVEHHHRLHYDFFYQELFAKIGMYSVVMEPDPAGTYVGSSYIWATPRDWARFGLLYLQDGVWQEKQILPPGWVDYTTTPAPRAPRGQYGALFWLNAGAPSNPARRYWPDAPGDTFAAMGYHEQKLFIIPSQALILVRLGATSQSGDWDSDAFIADIIAALPDQR